MGFFDIFKFSKPFDFIGFARNITSIYCLLKNNYSDKFPDKNLRIKSMRAVAGIIGTMSYIETNKKQVNPDDITIGDIQNMAGYFSTSGSDQDNIHKETQELVSFINKLESRIISIQSKANQAQAHEIVLQNRNDIRKTVLEVFSMSRKGESFETWSRPIDEFFVSLNILEEDQSESNITEDHDIVNHQSPEEVVIAKKIDNMGVFLCTASKMYCDEVVNALNNLSLKMSSGDVVGLPPINVEPIYFEVLLYFFSHVDRSLVRNNINIDLRRYINIKILRILSDHFCNYFDGNFGNFVDLVRPRLSAYAEIIQKGTQYSFEFSGGFWYFSQLLLNARDKEYLSTPEGINLEVVTQSLLMPILAEFEKKYVIPFDDVCDESVANTLQGF